MKKLPLANSEMYYRLKMEVNSLPHLKLPLSSSSVSNPFNFIFSICRLFLKYGLILNRELLKKKSKEY